jgi:ATP-binding cassette subfamily C protein
MGPRVTRLLFAGIVVGVVLFFVELALAYCIQAFLIVLGIADRGTLSVPSWIPASTLFSVLVLVLPLGALRGALQGVQLYLQGASFEIFRFEQRSRLIRWSFFSNSPNSGMVTTLFNEATNAGGAAISAAQVLALQLTLAVLLGINLFVTAPLLTVIAVGTLGIVGLVIRPLDPLIKRSGEGLAWEAARVNRRLLKSIKNLLFLQISGGQAREEELTQGSLKSFLDHVLRYNRFNALKYAIPQVAGIGLVCALAVLSRKLYADRGTQISIAYFYLFGRFVLSFSEAVKSVSTIILSLPNLAQLSSWWWAEGNAISEARQSAVNAPRSVQGPRSQRVEWNLSNVGYSYPEAPHAALSNLNLSIRSREMTVIIGPSGSGKSTLMHLLLGKLKPTEGTIQVTVPEDQLLACIGYVGPESFLFDGSIHENLVYGLTPEEKDSLTPQLISSALEKAECGFVFSLTHGLEHRITEQGEGLSAGQKQRLSLARALLRRHEVLFLDEATANLDEETEQKLVNTFEKLKGEITIVAITHRMALLKIADHHLRLS